MIPFNVILPILVFSGLLGGLVSYFVNFKNLRLTPLEDTSIPKAGSLFGSQNTGVLDTIYNYLKKAYLFYTRHWEFFAYLIIGIAGAMLVPLVDAILGDGLKGLNPLKEFNNCLPTNWEKLILFGYGIVFSYGSNRIFINVVDVILRRLQFVNNNILTHSSNPPTNSVPNGFSEIQASGAVVDPILKDSSKYNALGTYTTGEKMTENLLQQFKNLVELYKKDEIFKNTTFKILKTWAEDGLHYEARAIDFEISEASNLEQFYYSLAEKVIRKEVKFTYLSFHKSFIHASVPR